MFSVSWLHNISTEQLSTPEQAPLPVQSTATTSLCALTHLCSIHMDKLNVSVSVFHHWGDWCGRALVFVLLSIQQQCFFKHANNLLFQLAQIPQPGEIKGNTVKWPKLFLRVSINLATERARVLGSLAGSTLHAQTPSGIPPTLTPSFLTPVELVETFYSCC